MELTSVERSRVTDLREERRRGTSQAIVPGFYAALTKEAATHLIQEEPGDSGRVPQDLGYVLSVERPHAGHTHVTVVELHLAAAHQTRYEDVLDLVRERLQPSAYLVRTDDCRLNATLLSRGLQVEAAAVVMLPEEPAGTAAGTPTSAAGSAPPGAVLVRFGPEHLPGVKGLLAGGSGEPLQHRHPAGSDPGPGTDPPTILADLELLAGQGRNWVLLQDGHPVAVIARLDGGDGEHELLDLALAHTDEDDLAWALRQGAAQIRRGGRRPAAVIDAAEAARRRIFRKAGFFSAAAYMVFYDPEVGRPSVGTITLQDLRDLIDRQERFRLVDVLGEKHWRAGHLPGSEWIDFRGLAREARRRFKADEPLVLYCDGFT